MDRVALKLFIDTFHKSVATSEISMKQYEERLLFISKAINSMYEDLFQSEAVENVSKIMSFFASIPAEIFSEIGMFFGRRVYQRIVGDLFTITSKGRITKIVCDRELL
ncbi:hypothetical protein ADUPG1_004604, partial [Aduncisulcus paluster]